MASWKQQALIEAPIEKVWELLEDPTQFAEWSGDTIEVTGAPTKVEKGSTFDLTSRGPLGLKSTTTFEVEELDDLREIKLRCQRSGYYSHWLLTDARGNTFTEVEMGVEPEMGVKPKPGFEARVISALHTKGYLRRAAEQTLDGLKRALERAGAGRRPAQG
jgi:uncharacterized protein YndB with AHSA1/START domain